MKFSKTFLQDNARFHFVLEVDRLTTSGDETGSDVFNRYMRGLDTIIKDLQSVKICVEERVVELLTKGKE